MSTGNKTYGGLWEQLSGNQNRYYYTVNDIKSAIATSSEVTTSNENKKEEESLQEEVAAPMPQPVIDSSFDWFKYSDELLTRLKNPPVFEIKHKDEVLVSMDDKGELSVKDNVAATTAARTFIKSLRKQGLNFIQMSEELNQLRAENERNKRRVSQLEEIIDFLENKYGKNTTIAL